MHETLNSLDQKIRDGQISAVMSELQSLSLSDIPKKHWALFANLCWRTGLGELGLKLLNSTMREANGLQKPSEREYAEYSNCLTSVGCCLEALHWLQQVGAGPWISQAKAFAEISRWNYQSALNELDKIIDSNEFSPYSRLINRVNQIACYNFLGRFEEALIQIERLFSKSTNHQNELSAKKLPAHEGHNTHEFQLSKRLIANLWELNLQALIGLRRLTEASDLVAKLESENLQGVERIFFKKWKAVLLSLSQPQHAKNELFEVREEAIALGRWELVRDIDFYIATAKKSEIYFWRLYFATPFESYRKLILEKFRPKTEMPLSFNFHFLPDDLQNQGFGERAEKPALIIDLEKGQIGDKVLSSGLLLHRLLCALVSDLYRPHAVGSLYQNLFPHQYFNPQSSPNRIHQAVKSLRAILKKYNLEIEETQGRYRLITRQLIIIIIPQKIVFGGRSVSRLELVRKKCANEFSTRDVMSILECTAKTAQRLIKEGIERGECEKQGKGSKTFFQWKPSKAS